MRPHLRHSSASTVSPTPTNSAHDSDTASSSSNSSVPDGARPTIRARRVRGVPTTTTTKMRNGVCPSTPILTISTAKVSPSSESSSSLHTFSTKSNSVMPAPSQPLLYKRGMPLRLSVDSVRTAISQTHLSSHKASNSCSLAAYSEEHPVRKKSGALLKSSLKLPTRSRSTDSLATLSSSPKSCKSEPGTPSSKVVHFDAELEHIKLFLPKQKPLAVLRDGSPTDDTSETDDTSGTDSDFPQYIFGSSLSSNRSACLEGGDERKRLVMHVGNMPVRAVSYPTAAAEVVLEGLCLAPDGANILGKVRVRNLAYSKSITVRFTFDSWRTTSEVTGRYEKSLSPEFDLFSFSIWLNDLLARIEGKTLVLAVRSTVDGREMWDNNSGQNYVATFSKVKYKPSPPTMTTTTDLADLRRKLEKVVESKESTGSTRRHQAVPAKTDFRSLRFPVNKPIQSLSSAIPRQKSPPGSSRNVGDEVFYNVPCSAKLDDRAKNHQHAQSSNSLVKCTPPGTPCAPSEFRGGSTPSLSWLNSFHLIEPHDITTPRILGYDISLVPDSDDSELSTPPMVTPPSSPIFSPTPKKTFLSHEETAMSPETHCYRQFLNEFSLTTIGLTLDQRPSSASFGGVSVIDGLPPIHSASDIKELQSISSGISPRIGVSSLGHASSASPFLSPRRTRSLDDLLNPSELLTPMASRLSLSSSV